MSDGREPDGHPVQAQCLALPLRRRQLGGEYYDVRVFTALGLGWNGRKRSAR